MITPLRLRVPLCGLTLKVSLIFEKVYLQSLCFVIGFVQNYCKGCVNMKQSKKFFLAGGCLTFVFAVWTVLIQIVDVQFVGVNGTTVGFATLNTWFHSLTGVNMLLYNITDWLGLVPIIICMFSGVLGFVQLIKRKSLRKVDSSLIISGVYYVIVILCYLIFEMYPVNYRPILINGFAEASYPSSTTLLVLCVMPTFVFQTKNRVKKQTVARMISVFAILFSAFMVVGRLISGVHWATDIVGSVFLSAGLFCLYNAMNLMKTD